MLHALAGGELSINNRANRKERMLEKVAQDVEVECVEYAVLGIDVYTQRRRFV